MTRPRMFRSIPADLQARVRYGVDIAALDYVHDGDTPYTWLARTHGNPGYTAIRIRDLHKHELNAVDPVLEQLAQQETDELIALFASADPLFTVHYQMTRTGGVVASFTRAVASIMLRDGRDVATVLQPIRAMRVARLRELGKYPQEYAA